MSRAGKENSGGRHHATDAGDINETMLWLGSSPRWGDMQTVILCGGRGVGAMPSTLEGPKPLLLVGDRPVLAHVMEIYVDQGFTDFVLAAGYKAERAGN